jgi:nitroreductase
MTGAAMRDFLGLGAGDLALGLFHIGYPSVEWPKGYRKPLDQVVRWEE